MKTRKDRFFVKRHRKTNGTRVRSHLRRYPKYQMLKRPKLPPTTKKGIETYYRKRGYRINPSLESPRNAALTFDKPLPDGRRIHGEVKESKREWIIKEHYDASDPYKHPLKHLEKDLSVRHRGKIFKIRKKRARKSLAGRLIRGY